jgi:hypothetical protein
VAPRGGVFRAALQLGLAGSRATDTRSLPRPDQAAGVPNYQGKLIWLISAKRCAFSTVRLAIPTSRRYDEMLQTYRLYRTCLPSSADRPPSGPDWVHEIKHDGYRLMARRDPVGIRLLTRTVMTGRLDFPSSLKR